VGVCRQRSANADIVGSSLFLGEPPLPGRTLLALKICHCEIWPKRPSLHFYQAMLWVEADNLIESCHVDQDHAGAKLLASHRMAPASYGKRLLSGLRCKDGRLQIFDTFRPEDAVNVCAVELRMDVVYYQ
jgi:hypothetical protein